MNVSNTTKAAVVSASIVPLLQAVLKGLNLYGALYILIPGLFLNIITTLVFLRKKFWTRTKMGYYYSVSSAISTGQTAIGIIAFLPAGFGDDFQLKSSGLCEFIWQIRVFFGFTASYFQILISVNLAISTVYVNRFPALQKTKNLIILTAILFALIIICNSVQWLRVLKYTPVLHPNATTTYTVSCILAGDSNIVYLLEAMLRGYIPGVFGFVMNLFIIKAFLKSKRSVSAEHKISSKEIHFAVSLVALNFLFIASIFPTRFWRAFR
jgi:hypothetical protein